jgi:hypothetical protein
MNCEKWIHHFRCNRQNRPEPDWKAPIELCPRVIPRLARSLEQFQLGDGGGPASLIAHDAESFRGSTHEIRTLVDFWFAEEREHSRLLGCAVERFGGRRIRSHWSFTAFCLCRRVLGVRFELLVLLLTEIVSTAYYRVLRRHAVDAALRGMCMLILRDEAGHIAFHRDRLAAVRIAGRRAGGALWAIRFRALGFAAAAMLWVNHGRCLCELGASTAEYYHEVRLELRRFAARLRRNTVAPRVIAPVSLPAGAALRF